MKTIRAFLFLVVIFLFSFLLPIVCHAAAVSFTVDKLGLRSLAYGGVTYISPSTSAFGATPSAIPLVHETKFLNAANQWVVHDSVAQTQTLDADALGNITTFSWGQVHVRYSAAAGNRLGIVTTIINTTDDTMDTLSLNLLTLKVPSTPIETDGTTQQLRLAPGDPAVMSLTHGSGKVVLAYHDVDKPLTLGFPWALDKTYDFAVNQFTANFTIAGLGQALNKRGFAVSSDSTLGAINSVLMDKTLYTKFPDVPLSNDDLQTIANINSLTDSDLKKFNRCFIERGNPLECPRHGTVFPLWAIFGGPWPFTSDWSVDRTVAPHSSTTIEISLTFGNTTDSQNDLAADVYDKFVKQYPFKLHWPDRRVIGSDFWSASSSITPANPRGWWFGKNADYTSAAGRLALKADLMARVSGEITILKSMNAQGVIIWDLEGAEMYGINYVGDPRQVAVWAPEMDAIIDDVFNKFKDAGFRVGMTIRPQVFDAGLTLPAMCRNGDVFIKGDEPLNKKRFSCQNNSWVQTTFDKAAELPATCTADQIFAKTSTTTKPPAGIYSCETGSWVADSRFNQQETTDYAQAMIDKIGYAKRRWGATLFYVDSYNNGAYNYHGLRPENFQGLKKVAEMFPDVLLIPERGSTAYFTVSLPYLAPRIMRPPYCGTSVDVLKLYPSAGSSIRLEEVTDRVAKADELATSISWGDLLLTNAWYASSGVTAAISIYAAAALKPVPGDSSGDKRVSVFDAALALKFSTMPGVTGDAPSRADINHDGIVTTNDSATIARKALGL
ncbi:MAG: dockerin type I repeat-containing protein [Candidatus Omnitrophica bacterium]|nr:dockerin type I repeat-containing protein [Candidatus Omnitrophota bacterium]